MGRLIWWSVGLVWRLFKWVLDANFALGVFIGFALWLWLYSVAH